MILIKSTYTKGLSLSKSRNTFETEWMAVKFELKLNGPLDESGRSNQLIFKAKIVALSENGRAK